MFGSDYSGSHGDSQFRTYGFVIGDADASPEWPSRCRKSRNAFLADGRRMAFKSLNDSQRRRALIPFLEASEAINGHVVVVAINKKLTHIFRRIKAQLQSGRHYTDSRPDGIPEYSKRW